MKIQIASDLHTEMHRDHGAAIAKALIEASKSSQVEVLMLAGDITSSDSYIETEAILRRFCDGYPHVVAVVGNHFFYGSSVYRKERHIEKLNASISNLHILDNSFVMINNQRFIGGTAWFSRDPNTTQYQKNCMADFMYIKNFEPWVYGKNKAFRELMEKELCNTDVAISHHLPSYMAIAPQFKNDQLNRFFLNPMDKLIQERQPKVWAYGHSHVSMRFTIGSTKLINNSLGYPGEYKQDFDYNAIIDV